MMRLMITASLYFTLLLTPLAWSSPALNGEPPPVPAAGHVKLTTDLGDIVVELFAEKAPLTVANFVNYVNSKHYEGTVFHRVIKGFMVQGGGFHKNLNMKPTLPPIQNEADNGLKNLRGTIAMARTNDPHSATAQFFINLEDNSFLDHKDKSVRGWGYTVFGKVVEGMDVVNKMGDSETGARGPFSSDVPRRSISILNAIVIDAPNNSTTPR